MTYEAIVARVHTRPHPNADRVQLGTVLGYQVVVGLDTTDGELGVFFPEGGQLSHDFCLANNLYVKHPDTGEPMGGYFDKNRRIRAQRFRGEISEGMWCPLSYFPHWVGEPPEGHRFTHVGAHEICRKYVTPATRQAGTPGSKKKRSELENFPRHYDTPQLRENLDRLRTDSTVYVTEKLHGTSARTGYVMVPAPKWYHRAWNWLAQRTGLPTVKPTEELQHVSGTRNCILEPGAPGEKGQDYRQQWHNRIAPLLMPGEIVHYEIVGYDTGGRPIMPPHTTDGLDKKDLKALKKLGCPIGQISYAYGCEPGESACYVYRVTRGGDDMSWCEMEARCSDLGLPTVPLLHVGTVPPGVEPLDFYNGLTRGSSKLSTIPKEGVCCREEWTDEKGGLHVGKWFKHKSFAFCALEGIRKNDENYVDTEEAA